MYDVRTCENHIQSFSARERNHCHCLLQLLCLSKCLPWQLWGIRADGPVWRGNRTLRWDRISSWWYPAFFIASLRYPAFVQAGLYMHSHIKPSHQIASSYQGLQFTQFRVTKQSNLRQRVLPLVAGSPAGLLNTSRTIYVEQTIHTKRFTFRSC